MECAVTLPPGLEALIDFADEELPTALLERIRSETRQLAAAIDAVLDDDGEGERVRSGVTVSLAGPVNAGKSTLLNRLAGRPVAIVSSQAGTTRDIVSVRIDLDAGRPGHGRHAGHVDVVGAVSGRQKAVREVDGLT